MNRNGAGSPARIPELLAPAGTPEALYAAVAAGADAVYLGGKRFGARQYAGNFSEDGIEKAVSYAHARGVKVYVTVNTLIHDRELAEVLEYLIRLYAMGVDAVLMQDTGLASLAGDIVPGLPLHASTQMTIHNAAGVLAAAELGFSRVVLARELTLGEIEEIDKATHDSGIGLEVFAHGALCFSYSGQCLLSSVIGGRSGNRGMCAQPCRKPYTLVAGDVDAYGRPENLREVPADGEYLLSPKDLCTYPLIGRLARSPVVSLKIEGRMKSPAYVAIVTAAYRRALDAIAAGKEPPAGDVMDRLALAFNRGFTDGYPAGRRHSAVMGREQPDNRGLLIGTVEQYREGHGEAIIRLTTGTDPVAGDGLFIKASDRKDKGLGFPLNRTPARKDDRITISVPGPVRRGSGVYMTSGTALAAEARRIIAGEMSDPARKVPIDAEVTVDDDGQVTITGLIDAGGGRQVPVRYRPDFALVPARTRPLTVKSLRENLMKTGGTPFSFCDMPVRYSGTRFAPVAEINRMRREFLARAEEALVAAYRPEKSAVAAAQQRLAALLPDTAPAPGENRPGPGNAPAIAIFTDTLQGVEAALEAGCTTICFEPAAGDSAHTCPCTSLSADGAGQVLSALSLCRTSPVTLAWKLPRILKTAELKRILAALPGLCSSGLTAVMAGDAGAMTAITTACPGIRVLGDAGMGIFNHRAAMYAASLCSIITVSPELSGSEIARLIRLARSAGCRAEFMLVVEGNAEAMVSENCVLEPVFQCASGGAGAAHPSAFYGLRDGTGRIFPVRADAACRTRIANADETCLIGRLPEVLQAGIGSPAIDARDRTPAYITRIVRVYRKALQLALQNDPGTTEKLEALKEEVRPLARGRITAGHFLKGL